MERRDITSAPAPRNAELNRLSLPVAAAGGGATNEAAPAVSLLWPSPAPAPAPAPVLVHSAVVAEPLTPVPMAALLEGAPPHCGAALGRGGCRGKQ